MRSYWRMILAFVVCWMLAAGHRGCQTAQVASTLATLQEVCLVDGEIVCQHDKLDGSRKALDTPERRALANVWPARVRPDGTTAPNATLAALASSVAVAMNGEVSTTDVWKAELYAPFAWMTGYELDPADHPDEPAEVHHRHVTFRHHVLVGLMDTFVIYALLQLLLMSAFPVSYIFVAEARARLELPHADKVIDDGLTLFNVLSFAIMVAVGTAYFFAPSGMRTTIQGDFVAVWSGEGGTSFPYFAYAYAQAPPVAFAFLGFLFYAIGIFGYGVAQRAIGRGVFLSLTRHGAMAAVVGLALTGLSSPFAELEATQWTHALSFFAGVFPARAFTTAVRRVANAEISGDLDVLEGLSMWKRGALAELGIVTVADLVHTDPERLFRDCPVHPGLLVALIDRALLYDGFDAVVVQELRARGVDGACAAVRYAATHPVSEAEDPEERRDYSPFSQHAHEVFRASRAPRDPSPPTERELKAVADVLRDPLDQAMAGVDVVVSALGGSIGLSLRARPSYVDVDTAGNLALLRAAERAGVERFVYVGVHSGPGWGHTRYVQAHERVSEALVASPLSATTVRPVGVFTAFDDFLDMARRGRGFVFGDGSAVTNPVHPLCVAEAVVGAIDGGPEDRSVGGPEVLSRRRIVELAFEAMGKEPRITGVPPGLVRGMAPLVRPLHPRLGELLAFVVAVTTVDATAPPIGSRDLATWYRERLGG